MAEEPCLRVVAACSDESGHVFREQLDDVPLREPLPTPHEPATTRPAEVRHGGVGSAALG